MPNSDITLSEEELRSLLEGEESSAETASSGEAAEAPEDTGFGAVLDAALDAQTPNQPATPPEGPPASSAEEPKRPPARVQPVQFAPLQSQTKKDSQALDLGILLDVPLRITVELGRTEMCVRQLLELGPGSVVELDRSAGEVLDVLVNGVPVAQGEVVVVDEQFGVRITQVFDALGRELLNGLAKH